MTLAPADETAPMRGGSGRDRSDPRRKINLRVGASYWDNAKELVERIHGRELTEDEFAHILFTQYVDLPNERKLEVDVRARFQEVKTLLEEHRERGAAGCVELVEDLIVSVLKGHVPVPRLYAALLEVQES